ncbi:GNAT family N-acetyltransferase [Aliikangiella sp. IMCC44653]
MPHIITEIVDYNNAKQCEELLNLLNDYSMDPMGAGKPLATETQQQLIKQLKKLSYAVSFIIYVDGKPAGMSNCFEGFSTFKCQALLNIHDFAISPEYRGYGLASTLLQAIEKLAQQRGYCKITLEVLEGNELAQNLYRKHGFQGYELDPAMGKAHFWEKPLKN